MTTIEKVFLARKGSNLSKEKVEAYGQCIEKMIETNNGSITPHEVVKKARSKKSPLHDYFVWDDTEAAGKYRLWQARHLMNSITVRIIEKEQEVRYFHNVTILTEDDKKERVYTTISITVNNKDLRKQIIQKAMKEIKGWTERYRIYSELHNIIEAIENALDE